jgi:hypothetical protein
VARAVTVAVVVEGNRAAFFPAAPEAPNVYLGRLNRLVSLVTDPPLHTLITGLLEDEPVFERFIRSPASIEHHDAYEGGLLNTSLR